MKITIVSDGHSTRIMDSLTGESVENVRSVRFVHEPGKPPLATVEILIPEVDLSSLPSKFVEILKGTN